MGTPSVYISSTFEDLKEYRAAVFEVLEKAGCLVGRMEGYAASDERPLDVCLQDVESRDIYVGIFAWRYGYIPPKEHGNVAGLSITECEYRRALVGRDRRPDKGQGREARHATRQLITAPALRPGHAYGAPTRCYMQVS